MNKMQWVKARKRTYKWIIQLLKQIRSFWFRHHVIQTGVGVTQLNTLFSTIMQENCHTAKSTQPLLKTGHLLITMWIQEGRYVASYQIPIQHIMRAIGYIIRSQSVSNIAIHRQGLHGLYLTARLKRVHTSPPRCVCTIPWGNPSTVKTYSFIRTCEQPHVLEKLHLRKR